MFDAARQGNSELLLAAVEAGLPVDMMNEDGASLLPSTQPYLSHITFIVHHLRMFPRSVGRSVVCTHAGNTLLMLASYAGHAPLVHSLLTKYNANPNKLNDRGQSPLAGAVFKGEDEVVGVLVRGGADPRLGRPSAEESARMFGRDLGIFDEKRGER